MDPDFCQYCGAGIPPREGEGTCDRCQPLDIIEQHFPWAAPKPRAETLPTRYYEEEHHDHAGERGL
jgi:hypothetical protein